MAGAILEDTAAGFSRPQFRMLRQQRSHLTQYFCTYFNCTTPYESWKDLYAEKRAVYCRKKRDSSLRNYHGTKEGSHV
jgi:hypothetical protein